ncbi:MAG: FecR domain-containing protein [Candidatus Promineifilaceae bacterium]|nr:FecR domain-containing protein [Candidatus Promineifilaceae bacterium]
MNNSHESLNRQRLAWAILIGSFFICIVITIAVPVSVNAFIQNASKDLFLTVQANQGTVGIDDESGTRRAVLVGETAEDIEPNSSILTDATATAIMHIHSPDDQSLLARLSIDGNSTLRIQEANTPRFAWSNSDREIEFELESGNIRLTLFESAARPIAVNLVTPQGTVTISEQGQYSVEVTNEATQVAVQEGTADISSANETLMISSRERAEIPTGAPPRGPLDPERNLIQNGDFGLGFDHWSEYTWKVELADQPDGTTKISDVDGDSALHFERGGIGHADARVQQSINQNVSDYESLRLLVTMRILDQSLGVCGVQGSECPLFIRINYVDENGVNQIWQQGFFAVGEVDDNNTPGACISCAVLQRRHERVAPGQIFFFDVDLGEELARQGALPPIYIESLALVASGHSFITEVLEVALIVE